MARRGRHIAFRVGHFDVGAAASTSASGGETPLDHRDLGNRSQSIHGLAMAAIVISLTMLEV